MRALGPALPLGLLPASDAQAAARAALTRIGKQNVYGSWLKSQEATRLASATCLHDLLPTPGPVDLASFVPFLD